MVFTSPVFLFIYLPLTLVLVWAAPSRLRHFILLLAGLFFYAWGEKGYVLLMVLSIGVNYGFGLCLARFQNRRTGQVLLALAVTVNLAALCLFKYTLFALENLQLMLDQLGVSFFLPRPQIHLPIGISFFTFEAISYLVDIRRGTIRATRDPIKLGVFLTLFPHLIAGPIVRYGDISQSLDQLPLDGTQAARGVRRFLVGLAKKLLLANPAGQAADLIFSQSPELLAPSSIVLATMCYTLQIYFDFSGYSDMAIGLGRLVGFELAENFRHPYAADSITDFWRRWHISLSTWFRDYVYIPLGGNRHGLVRTAFNLLTVFTLCGLWHGASWSFLIWGWYHGVFLVAERMFRGASLSRNDSSVAAKILRRLYVIAAVMIGWIFFRADDAKHALALLRGLFDFGNPVGHSASDYLNRELILTLAIGWLAAMPTAHWLRSWLDRIGSWGLWIEAVFLLLLAALCWIVVVSETYDPFIYFRF